MQVKAGISSAVFDIARPATIPSDNTEHKVTVAVIDLEPEFLYECVPKKSSYAYLKARVCNRSLYPLLAGPTNIFLDNNFIAKASHISEFLSHLNIDMVELLRFYASLW